MPITECPTCGEECQEDDLFDCLGCGKTICPNCTADGDNCDLCLDDEDEDDGEEETDESDQEGE